MIAGIIAVDPACGETIQGQRYAVGQQFKPHHDFFFTSEAYWPEQEKHGGQRTWTAMMFLNAVDESGPTQFPEAQVRSSPRKRSEERRVGKACVSTCRYRGSQKHKKK